METVDKKIYDALKASWIERGKFIDFLISDISASDKKYDRLRAILKMDEVFIHNLEKKK
jgi:hypothetical protein